MASFAQFLGRKVTVQYRVGDVLLPASGKFAADSGRSIFLEQHVEQRGKRSYFRWEIPYQYIHRIEEVPEAAEEKTAPEPALAEPENLQAASASAGIGMSPSSAASLLALPQRPKAV
ncbi:MAG TPA: hypothetical protein VK728_01430 [Candidatus Sulfotelmatobacter sp.]|jgi:hypothetical protein|nr:hypothetical protein [Candidatus Sulfotelmatobacter sp.]